MSTQNLDISDQANPGGRRATRTAPADAGGRAASLLGVAGMIIGLPALVLFWIPILGWLLMVAGLSLSVAGLIFSNLRERPAGFAIAGIALNAIALTIHNFIAMLVTLAEGFFEQLSSMLVTFVQTLLQGILGDIYQWLGPLGALLNLLRLFF